MTPAWVDNATISLDWLIGSEAIKKDFPNVNIIRCHYHFFENMKEKLSKVPNQQTLLDSLHEMWDADTLVSRKHVCTVSDMYTVLL